MYLDLNPRNAMALETEQDAGSIYSKVSAIVRLHLGVDRRIIGVAAIVVVVVVFVFYVDLVEEQALS